MKVFIKLIRLFFSRAAAFENRIGFEIYVPASVFFLSC